MLPLLLSALERPEEKRIFTLFFQTHEQGLLRYAVPSPAALSWGRRSARRPG